MARFEEIDIEPGEAGRRAASERAARAVARGSVLAHPTSTVYGIGGLPDGDTDARIAALKARTLERTPFLRVAPDVPTLLRALPQIRWNQRAERLCREFWPGPLTLVLPDETVHGVAVRVESHPLLRQVLTSLDGVMSSTSLNRAGQPPAGSVREARAILEQLPDDQSPIVFLPGGDLTGPPPSTLVSLIGPTRVLRQGAVTASEIRDALADLTHD